MGAAASSEEAADQDIPHEGWRILALYQDSPASNKNLVPFFDYIVGADGRALGSEGNELFHVIQEHMGKSLKLQVLNIRTKRIRQINLVPTGDWGGPGLLGLIIHFEEQIDFIGERCVRVLDVFPNSPASRAGLNAFDDYFLGSKDVIFNGIEELDEMVTDASQQTLCLLVFNRKMSTVREVMITPDHNWGGPGFLGCDVGHGVFHQAPFQTGPEVRFIPQNHLFASSSSLKANVLVMPVSQAEDAPSVLENDNQSTTETDASLSVRRMLASCQLKLRPLSVQENANKAPTKTEASLSTQENANKLANKSETSSIQENCNTSTTKPEKNDSKSATKTYSLHINENDCSLGTVGMQTQTYQG